MTDWLDDLAEDFPTLLDKETREQVREAASYDRRFWLIIEEES